jgi:hypothetical protein
VFATPLVQGYEDMVEKQLDLNLSVLHIMAFHRLNIKDIMDGRKEITHNLFLLNQDVR